MAIRVFAAAFCALALLASCEAIYLSTQTITASQSQNADAYEGNLIDASGGSVTLTFNDITNYDGSIVFIKRIDSNAGNTVTIQMASGDTIEGASSRTLGIKGAADSTFIGIATNSDFAQYW